MNDGDKDKLKGIYTEEESEEIVASVNASTARDFDGSRRRYADRVSTSEALINRANAERAKSNGHSHERIDDTKFSGPYVP